MLRSMLHATAAEPDRAARRRDIDECIDDELRPDPAQKLPVGEIFATVCRTLDVHCDFSSLPDEILGLAPPRQTAPLETAASGASPVPRRFNL